MSENQVLDEAAPQTEEELDNLNQKTLRALISHKASQLQDELSRIRALTWAVSVIALDCCADTVTVEDFGKIGVLANIANEFTDDAWDGAYGIAKCSARLRDPGGNS